jgi:ribosomal protein L11 methyltransferase
MSNVFQQYKDLWYMSFMTEYQHVQKFEDFLEELSIATSSREIFSRTVEAFSHDLWEVGAYFTFKPDKDVIDTELLKFIDDKSISIMKVEDKDWTLTALAALGDIKTNKFHIMRSNKEKCDDRLISIIINLTRAFGTGEHATTMGCMEAIESFHDIEVKNILDLGTGTGVLAIAAKKLWPVAHVVATDIDEVAIEVTKEHVMLNDVDVECFVADGVMELRYRKFDIIVANILARPLMDMSESICAILRPKGRLIVSGFLETQMEVVERYISMGCVCERIINRNTWITAILSKI